MLKWIVAAVRGKENSPKFIYLYKIRTPHLYTYAEALLHVSCGTFYTIHREQHIFPTAVINMKIISHMKQNRVVFLCPKVVKPA